jgi:hypothetical protein
MRALQRWWRCTPGPAAAQPTVAIATTVLAVLALAAACHEMALLPRAGALSALALAFGLALAVVVTHHYPIHVRHQAKVDLGTTVYYLLAVLVPPPLAALAAGLGALTGEVSRRSHSGAYPSDMATETGRRVLQVLAASLLAHAGGNMFPAWALVGAACSLGLLDAISFPLVLAPMAGERPLYTMVIAAREGGPLEAIQYAVGLVGVAAALAYPWTLPLLAVPATLVYAASKILKEMHDSTRQLLENMADAVDLRDAYTGGHSRRVTEYSAQILRALGLHGPEVDLILTAARVHDIGKIGIPDAILNKPGYLTAEERAVMEMHPVHGAVLLKRYLDFAQGIAIVRHHHERWDGAGYPDRLTGVAIPFGARVVAVADSFDAMTSDRPYRRGMPLDKAMAILHEGRGQQWDAAVVDAFLASLAARHAAVTPLVHQVPDGSCQMDVAPARDPACAAPQLSSAAC